MTKASPTDRPSDQSNQPSSLRLLKTIFWTIAVVLGFLQAWNHRFAMNPDGVSYLDIGDRFWSGHWEALINGYWSPLYGVLLGLALKVLRPSPYWEFPAIHLVIFLIYLVALWCFDFFLTEFVRSRRRVGENAFPEHLWWTIGYLLFISSSLFFINLETVSPDLSVAACVYLAVALLLRIRANPPQTANFVLLGVTLGIGYWSKTAMFPISLVVLAVTFVMVKGWRRMNRGGLLAPLVFGLFALPLVLALSLSKGRPTFGDSGKLNYAWEVCGIPKYVHWQGDQPGSGTPKHPTRRIFNQPATYEFATPIPGSYPAWFDASYWYEGLKTQIDAKRQIKTVARWLPSAFSDVVDLCGGLFSVLFLLLLMNRRGWSFRKAVSLWWLVLVSIAPILMYSMVFVSTRYIAAFAVFLWLIAFSGLQAARPGARRWFDNLAVVLALIFVTSWSISPATFSAVRSLWVGSPQPLEWKIANGLNQMGVRPGDKVASIGDTVYVHWYRLAHVQVVADVPAGGNGIAFWQADAGTRDHILKLLASTGARAVVIGAVPRDQNIDGWQRVADTDAYVYFLDSSERLSTPALQP